MKIDHKRRLRAIAFTVLTLFATACIDIDKPSSIERTYSPIMPIAKGYFNSTYSESGIQGGWYYYKNLGSSVTRFDATSFMEDRAPCVYNFGLSEPDGGPEPECAKSDQYSQAVDRICIEGDMALDTTLINGTLQDSDRYVGVGFELCSSHEDHQVLYQFPYTLGICPFQGQQAVLKKFVGIKFKITSLGGEKPPVFDRMLVQFKQRGNDADGTHPYCIVDGPVDTDENRCTQINAATDEAPKEARSLSTQTDTDTEKTNSNSYEMEVYAGDVRDKPGNEANLYMLQAIHFRVEPTGNNGHFSFCIEDLEAITSPPNDDPLGEKVSISTVEEPPPLDTDTEVPTPPIQWIDAKDTDESAGDVEDYPNGVPFYISKTETTVAQYYDYWDSRNNRECLDDDWKSQNPESCPDEMRKWDTCNVYKFILSQDPEKETDTDAGNQAANCINWYDADRFCKWVDGRGLPTKTEWEYAAKAGHRGYDAPWGFTIGENLCDKAVVYDFEKGGSGCGNGGAPAEVCAGREAGNTMTGICDMLGNLWEWVSDDYNPREGESWAQNYKIIKGGAFNTEGEFIGIDRAESAEHPVEPHSPTRIGFRCVL